eukprot:5950621-Prymnesium_polylepis.1
MPARPLTNYRPWPPYVSLAYQHRCPKGQRVASGRRATWRVPALLLPPDYSGRRLPSPRSLRPLRHHYHIRHHASSVFFLHGPWHGGNQCDGPHRSRGRRESYRDDLWFHGGSAHG